jgi:membrane protein
MMTVYIVGHLETVVRALPIGDWAAGAILFFLRLIPYCLFWLLFTFIYLVIPNAKVRIRSAFLGGIVAGTLFVILQWAYIHFQIGVSRYGAIYGSFAALPLFLVWLQLSWFLVLFGGEISYAHQTLDEHEFEEPSLKASIGFKRLLSLWIVHLAASRFAAHESPLTLQMLTHRYQIPHALAAPLLEELAACRLIAETSTGFIPARPAERLRISDVIEALDDRGIADIPYIDSKALAPFEKTLEHFRSLVENSPRNQRLSHVSDTI